IQKIPPPFCLIAGGRPSQARPLEEAGTHTYLHVPSPGLLELFLKDGARNFVFEGRECGGHVGPRSSFSLWDLQIERLLSFEHPEELHILFAGGIHDARSAAMVSAMAAPLAAKGAKIGVLMGTAYLFTEEAVATGAVQPAFQEVAVSCEQTVLLETAPGHSTRCVDTEYIRAFRQEKRKLEESGLSPQELWAALEQLNLGRLRVAAKGLQREGSQLIEVDDKDQRERGMYMIGQVAGLKNKACTMAELHSSVSEGCSEILSQVAPPQEETIAPAGTPVAVVGMACIFPGAEDCHEFWANIVQGENAVQEVPAERWSIETYYDPDSQNGEKTPSKWGAFLDAVAFDPLQYGIPPRSLAAIEPVQLLSLEVASRALKDAGYDEREFPRETTSVIFGAEAGTELAGGYGFRAVYPQLCGNLPDRLDEALPSLTEDSFPGVLANVIAGRIANRLDLGGINCTVDAACASSLAAVDMGIKELTAGTSDMVLCGGADLHNSINDYLMFASVHALSRKGQCQTFDANADGIVLGEGVGVIVLKRLSDAQRDGDRVYSVINAVAGSSDGKSLGLTAPRQEGQVRCLERAYSRSGISPAEVGLVEAHGTGTVVGDRTELATLDEVFLRAGSQPGSTVLGSVKSNIGHTKCAAGIAGLIKSAMALHHRVLPPTLNITSPNPAYKADSSPFQFLDAPRPWIDSKRKASLSAFGFGGTNFHLVMSEHAQGEPPQSGLVQWPAELFLFRGNNADEARHKLLQIQALLQGDGRWKLRDLAYSVSNSDDAPVQTALVAADLDELASLVEAALQGNEAEGLYKASSSEIGKVAFLMPGQGSQRPGMLRDLFVTFPELQGLLTLGEKWIDILFPPAAYTPELRAAQKKAITDTRVAQPTLGIVDLAMAKLLNRVGVKPDMAAGHSYGELAALAVAGVIKEADLLKMSERRGQCILEAAGDDPGTMAAVKASARAVEEILVDVDDVVVANLNAPNQTVISGATASVETAVNQLQEAGLRARSIPVACAFHSPLVQMAKEHFGAYLSSLEFGRATIPVWSNTSAATYPSDKEGIITCLAEHVVKPVRFVEQIEAMYADGARTFVECGPGRVMSGLVTQILGDRPHTVIATDQSGRHGLSTFLQAVAQMAVHGLPVDPSYLYQDRQIEGINLAEPEDTSLAPSTWMVNGHRSAPINGELPPSAMKRLAEPVVLTASEGSRDGVVLEYLKNMREMVSSQRDVMLGFLGATSIELSRPTEIAAAVVDSGQAVPIIEEEEESLIDALVSVVSERTGYPAEMLGLDMDLEADLSIDSIKRIEILGALSDRIGLGSAEDEERDQMIEDLAAIKTLRGIVEWLESRDFVQAQTEEPIENSDQNVEEGPPLPQGVKRYTLQVDDLQATTGNGHSLDNLVLAITPDEHGVAEHLISMLEAYKARPQLVTADQDLEGIDGLINLASFSLDPQPSVVKTLFKHAQQLLVGGGAYLLAATGYGGDFGRSKNGVGPLLMGGISGLCKSAAKEWPEARIKVVDFDTLGDPELIARQIIGELLAADRLVEVGYCGEQRKILNVVEDSRVEEVVQVELDNNSVILVTGGARGITAQAAIALAQKFNCRFELVGRSPLPHGKSDNEVTAAIDRATLRKLLISRADGSAPAEIESACNRILADREIQNTLMALEKSATSVRYHSLDVRDSEAFGGLLDQLYSEHGRLDGVLHGAGVIEDKLMRHKTADSFERVFDTKVSAAVILAQKVRADVGFVVFFSSVSGAFGNRGQSDYAAANEALDKIALSLNERVDGRVVSINWGPWA
ncbi:MAG TPA: SDR family NAD(P)-dependent oxidoreductase, partial [Myxococcales bacterium]|nr:SDR family NAD(P)-dependent oxidoreductase [Myxococcales bacterium]